MELWGWLIGYVVLFALLHLLLYYFYVRREDDGGTLSPSFTDGNHANLRSPPRSDQYTNASENADDVRSERPDRNLEFEGETVSCPHCGVTNEADRTFTYCWNCISTIRQ